MQRANRCGVPFWPAASIHDVPYLIFDWQDMATLAEEKARPERERLAAQSAAFAATMRQHR